ncbi:PQQ-binding-like beta-propeller repeat protein [Gordonia jinhuaensis]|uniref:Pyrrolo-quinoline quinone repeat domain-containing protein n=1 Tax=Gordonia jinhuaensis TaxID=1517702 RepID=A0A916SYB0_9ACTN|nr:PQQ-binding-like beta-propeller repeat protein [Gordonia jinhuaensis]GGB23203.1 hypothetical protein GCM10011489_09250 [Gordonia jinhuaensis]
MATACSSGTEDVGGRASAGWSSAGGNAANSNFAAVSSASDLSLSWSRDLGGPITAPVVVSGKQNVAVSAATSGGCAFFLLDSRAGRKDFCRRFADGATANAPLVDQFDNYYIGEPGTFYSINAGGGVRWKFATEGMALPAKFGARTVVLVATTQGQLLALRSQTGDLVAAPLNLRPDVHPDDPTAGLDQCAVGGPQCAIAAPPAVDTARQRAYLIVRASGASAAQVVGVDYSEVDGTRKLRSVFQAAVPDGATGTPVLSADGTTLYVFGTNGHLYAIDTGSAAVRWSFDLGGYGYGTMSVSPEGVIMPAPALGSPAIALRDNRTSAAQLWRRDDLHTAGLPTLAEGGTAWVPVRDPNTSQLSITEVSARDGTTKGSVEIGRSEGFVTGVSIGTDGAIATAATTGTVYYFTRSR